MLPNELGFRILLWSRGHHIASRVEDAIRKLVGRIIARFEGQYSGGGLSKLIVVTPSCRIRHPPWRRGEPDRGLLACHNGSRCEIRVAGHDHGTITSTREHRLNQRSRKPDIRSLFFMIDVPCPGLPFEAGKPINHSEVLDGSDVLPVPPGR